MILLMMKRVKNVVAITISGGSGIVLEEMKLMMMI